MKEKSKLVTIFEPWIKLDLKLNLLLKYLILNGLCNQVFVSFLS